MVQRAWILVLVLSLASVALAQDKSKEIDLIRQQMELLQQRLQDLDEKPATSQRVSEISTAPARPAFVESAIVVRIYDVSDMFTSTPHYLARHPSDLDQSQESIFAISHNGSFGAGGSFGGGQFGIGGGGGANGFGGGMGGGMFQVGVDDRGALGASRTSMNDLITAITTTISPESWAAKKNSISLIGTSLLVSADEQTHKQLAALLDLLRERWGGLRLISLKAYWLWLTDEELQAAGAKPEGKAVGLDPSFSILSDEQFTKLIKLQEGERPRSFQSGLTCYSGQTVHTLSGEQKLVVTGMTPVVAEQSFAYQPTIPAVFEGAMLQITPLSSRSGKFVVLDVHSRVNEFVPGPKPAEKVAEEKVEKVAEKIAAEKGAAEKGDDKASREKNAAAPVSTLLSKLDEGKLRTHRLSTTLRAPVGQPTLVGGMTFMRQLPRRPENLYLFVRVAVQDVKDEPKAEAPAVKPAGDKPDGQKPNAAKPDKPADVKATEKPATP